jgi:DNA-binding beta-propeller fold protein YncE
VADTKTDRLLTVGPFSGGVRPFTIDGRETRCYVNVNDLLGFEIGDLKTGQKLASVIVQGFEKGPTKRHGCPSHGIGLTPDETELWVTDAANSRVHVFDAKVMPPRQLASIELRDQPGWITFSIDGKYAYPSTGDVIDTKTRQIVALLADEEQRQVQSEKMIEIDLRGTRAVRVGDQFGIGRVVADAK